MEQLDRNECGPRAPHRARRARDRSAKNARYFAHFTLDREPALPDVTRRTERIETAAWLQPVAPRMAGLFSLDLQSVDRLQRDASRRPMQGTLDEGAIFAIDTGTRATTGWRDGRLLMHVDSLRTCALNGVGSRVWALIEEGCSIGEMVGTLSDEYDATAPLIERNLRDFLADLLAKGFIVEGPI